MGTIRPKKLPLLSKWTPKVKWSKGAVFHVWAKNGNIWTCNQKDKQDNFRRQKEFLEQTELNLELDSNDTGTSAKIDEQKIIEITRKLVFAEKSQLQEDDLLYEIIKLDGFF